MSRTHLIRPAAALLGAALLLAGCSAGSTSKDEAATPTAQELATQLQATLAAAGLAQPSTQVLTTLYGEDGGVSCQNAGELLHIDGLALFGNPSHSRRVPLDPKVAAYDHAVISTYCPELLPPLQQTQDDQTTPQQTIG
jgi:hypothetical protein